MSNTPYRILRIFCVVGLVVIVGLAIFTHFCEIVPSTPHSMRISLRSGGILMEGYVREHLVWQWRMMHFFPWWIVLAIWGLLTAAVWFLTRRRKEMHGFPIEPTAKPK